MTVEYAINLVWKLLWASSLKTEVNSSVYQITRPINSVGESCVVNALPMNRTQMQQCILNVNVFVPNIVLKNIPNPDGSGSLIDDTSQPNLTRLAALGAIVEDTLSDYYGDGFNIEILSDEIVTEAGMIESYKNFKLLLYNINL